LIGVTADQSISAATSSLDWYHCPDCGAMLLAGSPHPKIGEPCANRLEVHHKGEGLSREDHWVLRDLSLRQLSLDRPEEVPQGLGGVYAGYFEREFPDVRRYQQVIRPVLETMAAAREPLSFDQLAGVLGWDDYLTQQGRGLLGSLFPSPDDVPRPFHGSVMEWLAAVSKAGPFYISPKEGQKRLARFAWEEYQRPGRVRDPYVVRHAVVHLRLAGELEKAFTLLQDDAYLAEFIRVASPDVLREELFQCWSAAEKTGQEESVLAHARSAACMSRGMYRARTEDVGRAITSFEEMPDQPSVVLDALRWNELCWLTKDYAPDRRPESLDIALRSLRLAGERLADDRCASLVAEVHRSAGWLFKDMNRPDDAEEVFKEALRIFERLDLTRQVAWTERDLGCLYRDLGRRKLAEQFLRQSEEAFRRLGDRRQLSVSLKDLGILSLEKASADRSTLGAQAALYFEEALELAEMLREHELVAWLLRYQGIAEGMQGRVEHGRKLIAGARSRFKQFPESNQALCDFVSQHLTEVRRPHLLELFGYLAATNAADLPQLLQ
jgi:tetratricopeptide (TPR) repeat protein